MNALRILNPIPWFACLAMVSVTGAGPVDEWKFHPVATAPYLRTAPTIDGKVEAAEWQSATELGPLTVAEGITRDLPHRVLVGYDAQNLYVGFTIDRPANVRQPAMPEKTGHIDNWRAGDVIELAVDVGHTAKRYFCFVLCANGAYSEGVGQPSINRNWNCEWKQAASLTDRGWQGEIAIPFSSLEIKEAPKPGDVWGFDFVDNQRTPAEIVSTWGFRGPSWHKLANFGHLRFGPRDGSEPTVRLARAGEGGDGIAVVQLDVVNPGEKTSSVTANVQLFRRKDGPDGGAKSYFDQIESGSDDMYESGQTDFYKGTKLGELIQETLAQHVAIEGAAKSDTIPVPNGQRRDFGVAKKVGPGEYVALYEVRASTNAPPLAAGVRVFRIEPPLALQIEPYWLHTQKLRVTADLRKVSPAEPARIVFTLSRGGSKDKPLAHQEVSVLANSLTASGWLPTDKLEAGFYEVNARLNSTDGKELAANSSSIEKPKTPVWHNNKFGRTLEVPKPWTPLKASKEGRVEVWGRVYDLSKVFPSSIVSQGEELLPEPTSLNLTSTGKTVAWKVKSLQLESATKGKAVYRASLESDLGTIEGTATIEFDGFIWYNLTLTPKSGKLAVDSLTFTASLAAKHSTLLSTHKFLFDRVLSGKAPVPVKQGAPGKLEESLLPFTPSLWMGDETGGLAWIAEGPVDWKIKQPAQVLEVQPADRASGRASKLIVHMIDHATELTRPMRLQFGLQATPARPMPPEDVTHVAQTGGPIVEGSWYESVAEAGCRAISIHGSWKGNKASEWGGWMSRPETELGRNNLKQAVERSHKLGMRVSIYTGWGVATDSEEWRKFGREMIRLPIENSGFGTYRESAGLSGAYIDYMAWAMANLIKEFDVDGVLWDSTCNLAPDENIGIGNGWVDDEGRVRPAYAVRGTRELFKRIYTLTHGELKDRSLIINHPGSIWCINVFSDMHHRGEGTPMHVKTLREAWQPLEEFRASYDGRHHGIPYLGMNKNFRRLPMRVNNHTAVTLLHGYHCKSVGAFVKYREKFKSYAHEADATDAVWRARLWLPMNEKTRQFLYYDKGPDAIHLEPATLLSSVFVSDDGKRVLLVVSNLDPKKIEGATVAIDFAKLGMKPSSIRAEDAVLETPVEIKDGKVKLEIEPERFRLLKLWGEE